MSPSRASNFEAIFAERIAQDRGLHGRGCVLSVWIFFGNYLHPVKF